MSDHTVKSTQQRPRASLLLVEDHPDQQLLIEHILRQVLPELTLVWATDAPSALAYLTTCQEEKRSLPRLMLLDLYVPTRDEGWALLRKMKANAVLSRIPVIIMSRSIEAHDINISYDLGVTSYIAKPVTAEQWTECFQSIRHYWFDIVRFPPDIH